MKIVIVGIKGTTEVERVRKWFLKEFVRMTREAEIGLRIKIEENDGSNWDEETVL